MGQELAAFSTEISRLVAAAAASAAAVHARPRFSSSGVFWRPGVIVTAEHTVRREDDIRVTLPDGQTTAATLAGSDPGTDLAVLRVEGDAGTPVRRAERLPSAGNVALSVGRSENSGVNATLGIISAVSGEWRTWRGGHLDAYLRLDLTLYPGSSGGVVLNTDGEALGVASSALSRIAGVAIPASTVERVVEEILMRGHVARGYLGVGLQPVELPDHQKGLIVLSLEPGGPAARAGVLIGDIFVSLDGAAVSGTEDVQHALEKRRPGERVEAKIWRGGDGRTLAIEIGERPRRS
ncbi:MAG TPA: trypsin-like peptidase domain-containing protein [Candidatus Limnocylindrales bacterium]|nr:trypsin-like peptidase domain-containing protein [Candidatus Limnocylindrales bacterium]